MVNPKKKKGKSKAAKRANQQNADVAHEPANRPPMRQPTNILELNDDCLLEIFKYLPLNDVCSLSQTCRRVHALGSCHFMLNYKEKVMVYVDWLYGDLITFPHAYQEKYVKCFAKSMRSVTLLKHFSTIAAMQKLNSLYQGESKTETVSAIQAIRFVDWIVDVSKAHCRPIAAILKHIESLTFENTSINADLNGCLFGFTPNLKRLTVLNFTLNDPQSKMVSSNAIWNQPPCPTLEYFAWHKGPRLQHEENEFSVTEMLRFLKANPGIKFVSLQLETQNQLNILTATGIQVNELFFTMSRSVLVKERAKIKEIVMDLKDFCEKQKSMKAINDDQRIRLHLKISGHDFEGRLGELESLAPYLVGLYFESYVHKSFASVFPKLINLKVLQVLEEVPAEVMCSLPNVEEIFISCKARPLNYYDNEIRILGSRLPTLKKLYLNGYTHRNVRDFLASLGRIHVVDTNEDFKIFEVIDSKRKKLAGAQKLKVFLEVEQQMRNKKVDYTMVEVLRTQTEAINNPLYRQTHLVDSIAAPDGCVLM